MPALSTTRATAAGRNPARHRVSAAAVVALAILSGGIPRTCPGQESEPLPTKWKTTVWEVQCKDPRPCAPADEIYEEMLGTASVWLESLGFRTPNARSPTGRTYIADVNDGWNEEDEGGHEGSLGYYSTESHKFHLRSDLNTLEGEVGGDGEKGPEPLSPRPFTPVHELFHAVEAAYHEPLPDNTNWIWEGMADAVLRAYMSRQRPNEEIAMDGRFFDEPLHFPGRSSGDPDGRAYGTWFFWYKTGEALESPSRVAYLHEILEGVKKDPGTANGLKGVDAGFGYSDVEAELGHSGVDAELGHWEGLYNVFPKFFTTFDRPTLFQKKMKERAALPSGRKESTTTIRGKVDMVAGRYIELELKKNTGRPVEVEIRFKEDHPDLHLVVDQVRFDTGMMGPRNVYRQLLVEKEKTTLKVIVVNVAPEAVETKDHRSFELEVTLREVGYCSMTASYSGDLTGYVFGDVAHYSTVGAATIYGSHANPEFAGEVMEGLGEFMAANAEDENEAEAIRTDSAEMVRQLYTQSYELPREALGISMGDLKLDTQDEEAAGLAYLTGGFKLELSVFGGALAKDFTGGLNPAMIRVTPGPREESTLDKVPFVWVEGMPGGASLTITHNERGVMAGFISASLKAEGYVKEDGAKPAIQITARFVALQGPAGCMTPF